MRAYTQEEFAATLADLGIVRGDVVHVSASLPRLGLLRGCESEMLPGGVYAILREAVGDEGALLVSAFFYEYSRHREPFDARRSPVSKSLGVFSSYVAARPDSVRSLNPTTCLAGVGPKAEWICRNGSAVAFGLDSPWDRLVRSDGKFLMLGVKPSACLTFVHHVEQMCCVPHMYSKLFNVPIFDDGEPLDLPVISHVRYLDFGIEANFSPLDTDLSEDGVLQSCNLGAGQVYLAEAQATQQTIQARLKKDPFHYLVRPPKFVPGIVPFDGAIPHQTD
jgi:aminoglycoside N3'-acetyltransferase